MFLIFSIFVSLLLCLRVQASSCQCGYKTSRGDVWQYAISTDFSAISNSQFVSSSDWTIDTSLHASSSSAPYALQYTSDNVAVQNSALELTCSAYNTSGTSKTIYAAEISTRRTDIQYGSFRARFKTKGGSGAVSALFFYANDSQEVDIELLTRQDPSLVDFTNQPGGTTSYTMSSGQSRTSYVDYRFDWLPSSTYFYVGTSSAATLTTDVPSTNGSIKLNSWANGGSYSGSTVPSKDSVMSVSTIELYFNTSVSATATSWEETCKQASVQPCTVDSTSSGNASASTQSSAANRHRPRIPFSH